MKPAQANASNISKKLSVLLFLVTSLIAGLSGAAPVCAPAYELTNSVVMSMFANCTPDIGKSITSNYDAGGYIWTDASTGNDSSSHRSVITDTQAALQGKTYTVKAKNDGETDYGVAASITIPANVNILPSPCTLKVQLPKVAPAEAITVAKGDAVTLIPSCTNATDGIDLYSSIGGSPYTFVEPPSGWVVSPPETAKYYVVGVNTYGDTASNEVVVTVDGAAPPPPSVYKSVCDTITPATVSLTAGQPSPLLTATCNNSPTAWIWRLSGVAIPGCDTTSPTCTVPAVRLPSAGIVAVTVTANNAVGTGVVRATAVITVSTGGGGPTVPSCSSITPANPIVAPGLASPLLTATCTSTPASYVWKVGAAILTACTGKTCTVPATSIPSVGTYNVTVAAKNAAGTAGTPAGTVITVGSAAPISCPQTITEKLFDYATPGVTQHLTMSHGKAIAIKFTTDDLVKSGSVQTESSTSGATVYRFMNLSRNKCDFSYTSMDTRTGCSSTGNTMTVVRYTTGTPVAGTCTLQKNTTYYANIRNENALPSTATYTTKRGVDTCPTGATCGFVGAIY